MDKDRFIGGLVGLSVGDALGVPVEFLSRARLAKEPVTGMRGRGSHHQQTGTWSDDSSLAFCTAESLITGYDLDDMGRRFLKWHKEAYWAARSQVFDIGSTTASAMRRLGRGVAAKEAGSVSEKDNGNGSLMRILPLALAFASAPLPDLVDRADRVSRITHGHARARIACGIYVAIARRVLQGATLSDAYRRAVAEVAALLATSPVAAELKHFERVTKGNLATLRPEAIKSDGYVVHTLEAALWSVLTTHTFSDAVLVAVNLGEDTDTTATVAGGLAGLAYGLKAIPTEWLDVLARKEDVLDLGDRLWQAVSAPGSASV